MEVDHMQLFFSNIKLPGRTRLLPSLYQLAQQPSTAPPPVLHSHALQRPSSRAPRPHSLVSSLVHRVMNDVCPFCGYMSLRLAASGFAAPDLDDMDAISSGTLPAICKACEGVRATAAATITTVKRVCRTPLGSCLLTQCLFSKCPGFIHSHEKILLQSCICIWML